MSENNTDRSIDLPPVPEGSGGMASDAYADYWDY